MSKNESIILISPIQFGYITDYYKWFEYLSNKSIKKFICFDNGLDKLKLPEVEVQYISNHGGKFIRIFRFFLYVIAAIYKTKKNDTIIISYFKGCSIFKIIFFWKVLNLDIRTESVRKNALERELMNIMIRFSTLLYDRVIVISDYLKTKFSISNKKGFVIPLGADIISTKNKTFKNGIRLLYVGTTYNRKLEVMLKGYATFIRNIGNSYTIFLDFVGDGPELESLISYASELGIRQHIKFWGRIPQNEVNHFFEECNVGISFIPVSKYYNFQPPTKTFEYLMADMFCLATNTYANSKVISKKNGILHQDTCEGFYQALKFLESNAGDVDFSTISGTVLKFNWNKIVNNRLQPILAKN